MILIMLMYTILIVLIFGFTLFIFGCMAYDILKDELRVKKFKRRLEARKREWR